MMPSQPSQFPHILQGEGLIFSGPGIAEEFHFGRLSLRDFHDIEPLRLMLLPEGLAHQAAAVPGIGSHLLRLMDVPQRDEIKRQTFLKRDEDIVRQGTRLIAHLGVVH